MSTETIIAKEVTIDEQREQFMQDQHARELAIIRHCAELRRMLIDERQARQAASEAGLIHSPSVGTSHLFHSKAPSIAQYAPYGDSLRRGFDAWLSRLAQCAPDIAREIQELRGEIRG